MKKVVIVAVVLVSVVLLARQFFFSEKAESLDEQAQQLVTEEVEQQPEPASELTSEQSVASADYKLNEEQGNEVITALIEDTLQGHQQKAQKEALEKVKTLFPQLKEEIETYQHNVAQQRAQVEDYQALVEQRNEQIKGGHVPTALTDKLAERRENLLASAKVLGQEAVKVNEAIREAASQYASVN
ncbi:hypothetical protein [Thalassomonas actiniarum]|uniref:Uncharacterized protein n=1 Tax=Thalassomonas actiniarum TaxID=485447 RepID=A0AAF0C3M0_9GAMM|nr:hypothetical protein [Thalassomonas actiniarum]WDD99085.1 hypothetical protein SG35_028360 [Thalassomonas actiniarum]